MSYYEWKKWKKQINVSKYKTDYNFRNSRIHLVYINILNEMKKTAIKLRNRGSTFKHIAH
jgi:hypothetical protein